MEIKLDHSKSAKQGDVPVFTIALGVDALHEYASLYCIVIYLTAISSRVDGDSTRPFKE